MIVGLTGTKASGKGEVARILQERGFFYSSLSDRVREEAGRRGLVKYTTKDLQNIGNELRQLKGNGVLAQMTLETFAEKEKVVIDGIRNLGEIEVLKQREFYLVAVDALQQTRYERLVARNRASDPKTLPEFLEMEKRDLGIGEEKSGQQVSKCMQEADYVLYNDYATKEKLSDFFVDGTRSFVKLLEKDKRRPSFQEIFMRHAYDWAQRSSCLRRHVGAVIVDADNVQISQGYNGPPRGLPHCKDLGGCERVKQNVPSGQRHEICRAVHAEQNAILNAHRSNRNVINTTLYTFYYPCIICAKTIINSGIGNIICIGDYDDELSKKMFKDSKVVLERFSGVTPKGYPNFWG